MNPPQAPAANRPRVLVVDDDPEALRLLEKTLRRAVDAEWVLTASPEEASRRIRSERYDLLITDLRMPVFDGLILLRMSRRHNPDASTLLISGAADATALEGTDREGAPWRFLAKPWQPEALVECAREGLRRARSLARQRAILQAMARSSRAAPPPRVHLAAAAPGTRPAPRILARGAGSRFRHTLRDPAGRPHLFGRRYLLEQTLKEGGTGAVFRARDTLLETPVAVKLFSRDLASDPRALDALKREARVAMSLSHSHIVRLHNLESHHGRYGLIMEYIDGANLRQWLARHGPMNGEQVAQIVRICSDALLYAHRRGVYHRDLKPDNIMIRKDGVLKLIDFGIAVHGKADPNPADAIEGTPWYMSPEEIRGGPIDGKTDVYSLGVTAHELLTGRLPFADEGGDTVRVRRAIFSGRLSPAVRDALDRATRHDPEERWSDVDAFALALHRALAGTE